MNKKKADQLARDKNTRVNNTSGTAQRARLWERLQADPINTFTIIRELNIVDPGTRINELRNLGPKIMTHHLTLTDDPCHTHQSIALYYLSMNPTAEATA